MFLWTFTASCTILWTPTTIAKTISVVRNTSGCKTYINTTTFSRPRNHTTRSHDHGNLPGDPGQWSTRNMKMFRILRSINLTTFASDSRWPGHPLLQVIFMGHLLFFHRSILVVPDDLERHNAGNRIKFSRGRGVFAVVAGAWFIRVLCWTCFGLRTRKRVLLVWVAKLLIKTIVCKLSTKIQFFFV